jgi:hypothetical protein
VGRRRQQASVNGFSKLRSSSSIPASRKSSGKTLAYLLKVNMRILNVKLTRGGKEYRASLGIYEDMPLEEFMNLLRVCLPLSDASVLGLRDAKGVLLTPNLLCKEPHVILEDDYEILVKENHIGTRRASAGVRPGEETLRHVFSDLRVKNKINEEQYFTLRTWAREKNESLMMAYQAYMMDMDLEGFKERLLYLVNDAVPIHLQAFSETSNLLETQDRRAVTAREGDHRRDLGTRGSDRPGTSRNNERGRTWMDRSDIKPCHKFIQIVVDMERQGLLDQRELGTIKSSILRENPEVVREFDNYFLENVNIKQLARRLQRHADRLGSYTERPSSPMPRKNEILMLVNSVVKESLTDPEDMEILNRLISEENEFVFSAFDMFQSDRDTEDLLDSLNRVINKHRQSFRSSQIRANNYFNSAEDEEIKIIPARVTHTSQGRRPRKHNDAIKLLNENFNPVRVKFIKLLSKIKGSEVHKSLLSFAEHGNAQELVNELKETCDRWSVNEEELSYSDAWTELLDTIDKHEDFENELDIYNMLRSLIDRSPELKASKNQIMKLYEEYNPLLMTAMYANAINRNSALAITHLLTLLEPEPVNVTVMRKLADNNFTAQQNRKFEYLLDHRYPPILSALEVFHHTGCENELIDTLEIIDKIVTEEERLEDDNLGLEKLINQKFQDQERAALLEMVENKDPRLKVATDVYDLTCDIEELVETLKFMVKRKD